MSQWKSSIAILMGIVILGADLSWLIVGSSYTYLPWLVLGAVIFLATLVWIALDVSMMREARNPDGIKEEKQWTAVTK
jgi:hypothetical protein